MSRGYHQIYKSMLFRLSFVENQIWSNWINLVESLFDSRVANFVFKLHVAINETNFDFFPDRDVQILKV